MIYSQFTGVAVKAIEMGEQNLDTDTFVSCVSVLLTLILVNPTLLASICKNILINSL